MRLTKRVNTKTALVIGYITAQIVVLAWFAASYGQSTADLSQAVTGASEKVYIAVEEEGKVAVLNPENNLVKYIDLNKHIDGMTYVYGPHNVQVAPDGKSVWVTGNVVTEGHGHSLKPAGLLDKIFAIFQFEKVYASGDHGSSSGAGGSSMSSDAANLQDEAIVIDPTTDQIIKRLPLGGGMHLAHVALTPDSNYALITAQEKDVVFKVNARTFEVEKQTSVTKGGAPHGLRITPDGTTGYIAMSKGKSMGLQDLTTSNISYVPLKGVAVQAGVTPNGKFAVASVYDSKSLAVYEIATKKLSYVDLPAEAKGPIQMYPTPDSRYIYMADQGYYFGQPTGDKVYKIDLVSKKVVFTITAGSAPHGVVVSKDGKRAYVTNLVSNDLSIIDTAKDTEISRIKIGGQPNGVSIWTRDAGGTP
jgi:YVTN family beta-propeller protein